MVLHYGSTVILSSRIKIIQMTHLLSYQLVHGVSQLIGNKLLLLLHLQYQIQCRLQKVSNDSKITTLLCSNDLILVYPFSYS